MPDKPTKPRENKKKKLIKQKFNNDLGNLHKI